MDFINGQALMDVNLRGINYTWTNRRTGPDLIQVRLDRNLISPNWLSKYNCSLASIIKIGFDHYPISFIANPTSSKRNFLFRFEKAWLSHPSLENFVFEWWNSEVEGTTLFRVAKKLNIIKVKVKIWNKETFGDIFKMKANIKIDIKEVQDKIQVEGLSEDLRSSKNRLLSKYHEIISIEETFWRQRSRALYLKEGEKNAQFFHMTALKHRVANMISSLSSNRGILSDKDEIRKEAVNLFSNLLGGEDSLDIRNQDLLAQAIPTILNEGDKKNLSRIPSNQEIKKTIFCFLGDKSPGLDRFPMFFFQNFWNIVEIHICNGVK